MLRSAMLPAFIATLLFSLSILSASRSARLLGSNVANFGRVVVAVVLLGLWAHTVGLGVGGGAFPLFFLSGCVGFGLGDMALFQTLPRLGPRLSSLMINCLAAPFAALIEWLWLDTRLSASQIINGLLILSGVGLALAPERHVEMARRTRWVGIGFGTLAGFGQGYGAVLSRKAYVAASEAGFLVDGGTAAYQRILGGLVIVAIPFCWMLVARRVRADRSAPPPLEPAARRSALRWVLLNGLTGPTVGVAFYQWALRTTPAGIVLPITATTPLVVIPFTYWLDGDRPSLRSLLGGAVAVAGVIGLTLL